MLNGARGNTANASAIVLLDITSRAQFEGADKISPNFCHALISSFTSVAVSLLSSASCLCVSMASSRSNHSMAFKTFLVVGICRNATSNSTLAVVLARYAKTASSRLTFEIPRIMNAARSKDVGRRSVSGSSNPPTPAAPIPTSKKSTGEGPGWSNGGISDS